jgi:hypothetical protein
MRSTQIWITQLTDWLTDWFRVDKAKMAVTEIKVKSIVEYSITMLSTITQLFLHENWKKKTLNGYVYIEDHLMQRSKNERSYTFTPPIRLHGVVLSYKKKIAGTTYFTFTFHTSNTYITWNCLLICGLQRFGFQSKFCYNRSNFRNSWKCEGGQGDEQKGTYISQASLLFFYSITTIYQLKR